MLKFEFTNDTDLTQFSDGLYQFVQHSNNEREFYEDYYKRKKVNTSEFADKMYLYPEHEVILNEIKKVNNSRVVLLGNGVSLKEKEFLARQNIVFYSDYTEAACKRAMKLYENTSNIKFGTIDAYNMPFKDNSIDFIYAYGVVHHLENIDLFFKECHRVLAIDGKSCFLDDAYSKPWVVLKNNVFRRIRDRSHLINGISPEDIRFSNTGGFNEHYLSEVARENNLNYMSKRLGFLHYIFVRLIEKLLTKKLLETFVVRVLCGFLNVCDKCILYFYPKVGIRLIWGVSK